MKPKESFSTFLLRLDTMLDPDKLPSSIPIHNGPESIYGCFLDFAVDEDFLEHTGSEAGAINEQFKGVFGWSTRSSGDGILKLEERGAALSAVVRVLGHYHEKYPTDKVLMKWGYDIAAAAERLYKDHGMQIPIPSDESALPRLDTRKRRRSSVSSVAVTETNSIDISSDNDTVSSELPPSKGKNVLSKSLIAKRTRGCLSNGLMNSVVIRHDTSRGQSSCYWECASGCGYTANGAPMTQHVFKHAASCNALKESHNDEHMEVLRLQSKNSLGSQLNFHATQSSISLPSIAQSASESSGLPIEQASKKICLDAKAATLDSFVEQGTQARRKADKERTQKLVDHTIIRLICVRGLVLNVVDSPEWVDLMQSLNPNYSHTSAGKFATEYIPREAAFAREEQLKELKQHRNITLTFDGGNSCKDSVYFVHATTPDRKHYFVGGCIGTKEPVVVHRIVIHLLATATKNLCI